MNGENVSGIDFYLIFNFPLTKAAPSAAPHSLQPYDTKGASPSSSGIPVLINVAINKAAVYVSHKTGATIIR